MESSLSKSMFTDEDDTEAFEAFEHNELSVSKCEKRCRQLVFAKFLQCIKLPLMTRVFSFFNRNSSKSSSSSLFLRIIIFTPQTNKKKKKLSLRLR